MKGNLKKQVADLQSSVQELTKRIGSLQGKFDSYLVPRLQKMDRELIELNTAIKQLKPEIAECGRCKWIKILQNEDQQNIGICNNPHSIQYKQEVLAEENCIYFDQCLSGGGAK